MGKLTRRFLFGDLYNIQAYEEYFAEMSRKGLHLEKVGSVFAHFREGEPGYLSYRIDMFKKDEKEIKIREHKEKGWEFIGAKEPFLIFSSKENSGLEELYETPEEQRLALRNSMKRSLSTITAEVIITLMAILTLISVFYMQVEIHRGFFLFLAEGKFLMTIGPILIAIIRLIRQRWHINRIMRTLKSGEFLIHYGNHLLGKIVFALRKVVFALFIVTLFYPIYLGGSSNKFDDGAMKDLPIIRVEDIEIEEYVYYPGAYNSLYKNWSLLVPKGYELWESVEINEGSRDVYDVSLTSEYYLGRFDFIAKGLEGDILHREEKRHKLKLNKMTEKDELVCYGAEDEDRKILLARKGLEVVYVRYYGEKSLDEIMKAVVEKLER